MPGYDHPPMKSRKESTLRALVRKRSWQTSRRVGLALVLAGLVSLGGRLPEAFRAFDQQARLNARGGTQGRLLAAADSLDVDNDFVLAALAEVPKNARYAVLLPPSPDVAASTYGIGALTLAALPGYVQYLLLPRRE